jgi:Actinobacteria/chloroflexi VLRF1 release factor
MLSEPAASAPRWIDVAPERFPGWIASFGDRHGAVRVQAGPRDAGGAGLGAGEPGDVVVFAAADGAVARVHAAFPPVPGLGAALDTVVQEPVVQDGVQQEPVIRDPGEVARIIAAHAAADRAVGVLLVRLGGYAAGVFTGAPPRLAVSKVGSRLVHGRSAAGGQSQQRFARRREKQAAEALGAAADTAAGVFGRYGRPLDALVLGGDRRAVAGLGDDPRLRGYFGLAVERFLTVPDPRLAVLRETPRMFRAIRIQLTEPLAPRPERAAEP